MYPIAICEDNQTQLAQITTMVKNYVLFHDVDFKFGLSTADPQACLAYIDQTKPQNGIYLLDIDLNASIDGIELAEKIRVKDTRAKLIFITTHDELAPVTLKHQLEALGFISKDQPVEKLRDELIDNLNLARARSVAAAQDRHETISFSVGSQIYNLNLQDVLLIVPSDIPHRLTLHAHSGEYEFYGKMADVAQKAPTLFRCAKSALINVSNIRSYDVKKRIIYFSDGLSCKCSVTKVKELKRRLKLI